MRNHSLRVLLLPLFAVLLPLFLSVRSGEASDFGSRSVLPNGLILLHSGKHSLPIVMVTVLVKAGPLNEPEEKAGLANLAAELLTEGTEKRTSKTISDEIEFIGASIEASAGYDFTSVTLSVLKKDAKKGFELLSDILLNPVFPEQEIKRERDLVKGSLRQREEDPSFLAERAFRKAVFGEHPYGRLLEGSEESIDRITREDLAGFHAAYYRPDNTIFSVVGDLNPDELNALMKEYFGVWKISERAAGEKTFSPSGRNGDKGKREVIKIDRDLTQATVVLGHPGMSRNNPDYYAATVMNYVFGGGGFSSRLMGSIREEKGLAYDISSLFTPYRAGGLFHVEVQTKNESADTVIGEILGQIKKIRNEHVTDEELDEAKSFLTGSFPRRLDTNRKIADLLALTEFYGLGLDYVQKYPSYINSVTKEDVLRVARTYLDPANYVLVIVSNLSKADLDF